MIGTFRRTIWTRLIVCFVSGQLLTSQNELFLLLSRLFEPLVRELFFVELDEQTRFESSLETTSLVDGANFLAILPIYAIAQLIELDDKETEGFGTLF
jgi:hypothetical protein